jgi:hypothetical protein
MDTKIPPMHSDIVTVTSESRPTPRPVETSFSDVMARSAGTVVGSAESAMTVLPGNPTVALAVRGGAAGMTAAPGGIGSPLGGMGPVGAPAAGGLGLSGGGLAEGPGATVGTSFGAQFLASASAASDGGAAASLQQSQQSNLYYLQLQQQVSQQSQQFETLSNVLKSESDTVKNAISNMH